MSDSTTLLDTISASQSQKEVSANALFDAGSPATLYGRRVTSAGLTWNYYGGKLVQAGALTSVANGSITLTTNTTNYIELDPSGSGVPSKNTTGFTAGSIPLYTVVVNSSGVPSSWTDHRVWAPVMNPRLAVSMGSDANLTLSQVQARADILDITSGVSLTATRNIVVPLKPKQWTVYNGTTGAQSLQVIGATGTGVTVANGKRAIVYADGTNVVRATADA